MIWDAFLLINSMISRLVFPETVITRCGFAYTLVSKEMAGALPVSIFKTVLFLVTKPEKTWGGIWLMLKLGSSWGKPKTGMVNTYRMASPTFPLHNSLSTTTDTSFIFPVASKRKLSSLDAPSLHEKASNKIPVTKRNFCIMCLGLRKLALRYFEIHSRF